MTYRTRINPPQSQEPIRREHRPPPTFGEILLICAALCMALGFGGFSVVRAVLHIASGG
jgi:hypothetical protein